MERVKYSLCYFFLDSYWSNICPRLFLRAKANIFQCGLAKDWWCLVVVVTDTLTTSMVVIFRVKSVSRYLLKLIV